MLGVSLMILQVYVSTTSIYLLSAFMRLTCTHNCLDTADSCRSLPSSTFNCSFRALFSARSAAAAANSAVGFSAAALSLDENAAFARAASISVFFTSSPISAHLAANTSATSSDFVSSVVGTIFAISRRRCASISEGDFGAMLPPALPPFFPFPSSSSSLSSSDSFADNDEACRGFTFLVISFRIFIRLAGEMQSSCLSHGMRRACLPSGGVLGGVLPRDGAGPTERLDRRRPRSEDERLCSRLLPLRPPLPPPCLKMILLLVLLRLI